MRCEEWAGSFRALPALVRSSFVAMYFVARDPGHEDHACLMGLGLSTQRGDKAELLHERPRGRFRTNGAKDPLLPPRHKTRLLKQIGSVTPTNIFTISTIFREIHKKHNPPTPIGVWKLCRSS